MKCYLECLVVFVCLSVLPLSVELSEAPGIFLQQLSVVYFFLFFLFFSQVVLWLDGEIETSVCFIVDQVE
jgi:hypothetical protein